MTEDQSPREVHPPDYGRTPSINSSPFNNRHSIEEYIMKLHDLTIRCHVIEDKQETLNQIKAGLHAKICREITILWLQNIEDACQMALKIE